MPDQVELPDGYYELAPGTVLAEGDLVLIGWTWIKVNIPSGMSVLRFVAAGDIRYCRPPPLAAVPEDPEAQSRRIQEHLSRMK